MAWLMRGADVLAAAEVAATRAERRRGLCGRSGIDGAFVLRPCRNVHTFGMQFPIDAIFCDSSGTVLRIVTLAPRRLSPLVTRSAMVIEGAAGSADRWNLKVGDVVEIRS